jgi:hypothetical protein
MVVTMHEVAPISLCMVTQDLFDTKKFLLGFCDNLILKDDDQKLKQKLTSIKRELNAYRTQKNFLDGYKAIIINNLDKIMTLVKSRFSKIDSQSTSQIADSCKKLMEKIMNSESFDDIAALEAEFKKNVTLPVYELFITSLKRR